MYQIEKQCKALELDKVLAMLAEQTGCDDSRDLALQLRPSTNYREVLQLMQKTADAHTLSNRYGTPSVRGVKNCNAALKRSQLGGTLSLRELLEISSVLRVIRSVSDWYGECDNTYPSLQEYFENLFPNRTLEEKLTTCILSEDELADIASPELADIRRKIKNTQLKVRDQLDKMIKSPIYQKLLQEPIVTMRDGRFVVPVKAECKNEVKGMVHDTSSSGATVFIEPIGVVEANNEVRVLEAKERQEINRIIGEFSAEVALYAQGIIESYSVLVELDLLFAKTRLADRMKANVVEVTNDQKIILNRARHPLIDSQKVVPVDIRLGDAFDTLVITGPNTGGKTVALKTLGLLTLMAMCGLMLPVGADSKISIFQKVLADIGDEQSIEQSLSTFSAHMTNIVSILEEADSETLVLLDELGAGTDPVEGAALAVAIIERLRLFRAKIAATTHYAEIKMFALETDGIENACCEFDVTTLQPTYRLLIGVPGRSNAFAISEKLGLDAGVIDRAKSFVSSENTRFEDVVSQLEKTRQELESEKTKARDMRIKAQNDSREIEKYKKQLERAKDDEIERARFEARKIVESVKQQSEDLMAELEEVRRQKDSEEFSKLVAGSKSKFKGNMRKLYDLADPVLKKENSDYHLPRPLKKGDMVLLTDLNKEGVLLSDPDASGNVQVQAGIFKTSVNISQLRLLSNQKKVTFNRGAISTKNVTGKGEREVKAELDLRGKTVDEALLDLDMFLDNAVLSGMKNVTVIHGKGTGALRAAVQTRLRKHRQVRTFRLGVYGEGESGVTVVELK